MKVSELSITLILTSDASSGKWHLKVHIIVHGVLCMILYSRDRKGKNEHGSVQ